MSTLLINDIKIESLNQVIELSEKEQNMTLGGCICHWLPWVCRLY